ncbi:hypothetical protein [Halosimplex salinum]|uniref:hypothetical protein n=1 Tax=Halosimplex salinum TaxID=1710538 RepID=UPI0013DDB547|nr:hypothetical protein [Halosimplex salinum]
MSNRIWLNCNSIVDVGDGYRITVPPGVIKLNFVVPGVDVSWCILRDKEWAGICNGGLQSELVEEIKKENFEEDIENFVERHSKAETKRAVSDDIAAFESMKLQENHTLTVPKSLIRGESKRIGKIEYSQDEYKFSPGENCHFWFFEDMWECQICYVIDDKTSREMLGQAGRNLVTDGGRNINDLVEEGIDTEMPEAFVEEGEAFNIDTGEILQVDELKQRMKHRNSDK